MVLRKIQLILFRFLTKKSGSLFTRGTDRISYSHLLFGLHEEILTKAISHYINLEYKDFFIDIGANIGLISCQSGENFKEIHMFEPNPLCCNILQTNTLIALRPEQINIYRYGLGESDKESILTLPRDNWGGAFIRDAQNSYSDDLLASKDGYSDFNSKNYLEIKIAVKEVERELKNLFRSLHQKDLTKGIIKIDVEGYEQTILIGIAKSLPADIDIIIIFESWDNKLNLKNILSNFERNCIARKIHTAVPWKKEWSKLRKIFTFVFKPMIYFNTNISDIDHNDLKGDIILEIN